MATFWIPPNLFMLFLARGPKRISRKLLPWLFSKDCRKLAVSSTGGRRAEEMVVMGICFHYFPQLAGCLTIFPPCLFPTCCTQQFVLIVAIRAVICSVTQILRRQREMYSIIFITTIAERSQAVSMPLLSLPFIFKSFYHYKEHFFSKPFFTVVKVKLLFLFFSIL